MEDDNLKVKRWSFCPTCKGGGLKSCKTCKGKGKVSELVPLIDIPKMVRHEYRQLQADFIREQMEGKVKV